MNNIYFTGDSHYFHTNIIKYTNRPFKDVEEMDNILINNTNEKVGQDDRIIHLGDFCFSKYGRTPEYYLDRINCKNITMILGNHDPHDHNGLPDRNFARLFNGGCYNYLEIKVPYKGREQLIVLSHYAMRVWNKSHHGSWHLFGHSHGTLEDLPNSLSIDVGVDCHNYYPISVDEVGAIMAKKNFKPLDHHGRTESPKAQLSNEDYLKWAKENGH